MNLNLSGFDQDTATIIIFVLVIVTAVIHIAFAMAVYRDAEERSRRGVAPTFVNGAIWGLTTLLGGVFTAAIYWIIHHSTLRREREEDPEDADE